MLRYPAVLLALPLLLAFAACGGDSKAPQIGEGPADDVHGVWQGTYMATDNSQGGPFCAVIEQDGRALSGSIAFAANPASDLAGAITRSTIVLTWKTALPEPGPGVVQTDIAAGGTLNGQVTGETASGSWTGTGGAGGQWTGQRMNIIDCSGATPTG